jgi:hypothetical protein
LAFEQVEDRILKADIFGISSDDNGYPICYTFAQPFFAVDYNIGQYAVASTQQ